MAFKVVATSAQARMLEKKGDSITGYVTDIQCNVGKFDSTIYRFEKKDGGIERVWGDRSMDETFTEKHGKKISPRPDLLGVMTRVTVTGTRQVGSGKKAKTYRDITVELDLDDRKQQSGKQYVLNSKKKMTK